MGRQAFGMSGADLEKVVNEAAMEAARQGEAVITEAHVYAALSTVEKSAVSYFVTELAEEQVRAMGGRKAVSAEAALEAIWAELAAAGVAEPTYYVMPSAGYTVPYLAGSNQAKA